MLKSIVCTLAAISFIVGANSAFASAKASLFLVGQIDVVTNLLVTPVLGDIDTLDIELGEVDRLVATVTEESNNAAGYRIDVESVNGSTLEHNDTVSSVTYALKYDNVALAVTVPSVGAPLTVKTSPVLTGLTTDTSDVEITVIAGGTALPAGAYTDTLIFTMVAL